jgi:hemoglobin
MLHGSFPVAVDWANHALGRWVSLRLRRSLIDQRPDREHIYEARRGLNDISVLLKSCDRNSLHRDAIVIWRISGSWSEHHWEAFPRANLHREFASGRMAMSTENVIPSLYDRLGGVYAIATVVDDFIDRIMIDPALNTNPLVDEAHHRVGKAGFKYLVTEMVGWAAGGPQKYTGRSMADSHVNLKITEPEWIAFCKDFQDTLDKFSVPAKEQGELFAIVQSTKCDIVSAAAVA